MLLAVSAATEGRAEDNAMPTGTSLNAGLSLTDGNSETLRANASLISEGEKPSFGSYRAGLEANYGRSRVEGVRDTDVDNARIFAGARRTICPHSYAYVDTTALYDSIADVDYRAIAGPGIGVYAVKNDRIVLSVDVGAAYLWEDVGNAPDDYFVLRGAQRLDVKLSETAKLWQSAEFLPKAEDFDIYLLTAEIGIEAAVNSRVNLRVVLQNKYDSEPAPGLKENDLALIAGLGVKL
jgi:putative salt-induced outer membrane protein YdiY